MAFPQSYNLSTPGNDATIGSMNLGRKLRELRQAKDWSLAELAKRSGVALSSLSRIETGKMTGTLDSHLRVARTLGIRLAELYASLDPAGPAVELKKEKDSDQFAGKGGVLALLASSPLQKKMLPALLRLPPKKSTEKQRGPAGSERFIYVLKGELEAIVGDQQVKAGPGESIYLQASLLHTLTNPGSTPVLAISVTCPPTL